MVISHKIYERVFGLFHTILYTSRTVLKSSISCTMTHKAKIKMCGSGYMEKQNGVGRLVITFLLNYFR